MTRDKPQVAIILLPAYFRFRKRLFSPWTKVFVAGKSLCLADSDQDHSVVGGFGQSHKIILFNQPVFWMIILGNPVPDNEENARVCVCPNCPTFKCKNLSNTVFCGRGKARELIKAIGRLCPNCPIFENYSLNQIYYCLHGKSAEVKT